MFALVDCNSFFCSCERLFRPDLAERPVIVLSNNDGCAIARTQEAKALGIKMGAPYFQIKELCQKKKVAVFSSNFSLYTNISDRVMKVLASLVPALEIYSIDEAFLDLQGLGRKSLYPLGKKFKEDVWRLTGIPVSVGIGPTKVLSKIGSKLAKRNGGVTDLSDPATHAAALEQVEVEDIWGIARAQGMKLRMLGIQNARQFRDYPNDKLIAKIFTKLGWQLQQELRGISCFPLILGHEKKKSIMCSRTFGSPVTSRQDLEEAVANYASSAAEKLRQQDSVCSFIEIFFRTSPFDSGEQYYAYDYARFQTPTLDTRRLIKSALSITRALFRHGFLYKKAGVRLNGIHNRDEYHISFFEGPDSPETETLMRLMDRINHREGPDTLLSAACGGADAAWAMNRHFKSPRYVTGLSELPKAF
jgi:DNA polymerase V